MLLLVGKVYGLCLEDSLKSSSLGCWGGRPIEGANVITRRVSELLGDERIASAVDDATVGKDWGAAGKCSWGKQHSLSNLNWIIVIDRWTMYKIEDETFFHWSWPI